MKFTYTEFLNDEGITQVIIRNDGASIPCDPANSDYQAYLRWLENPEAQQEPSA